ncbi:MAG: hypothetical protein HRU30_10770 [Rhodobacteraceae bacterium]|nr:hypothetical protein [Paracoccaceae bacterium]
MIAVAALAVVLAYLGRFWIFDLWGRPGLFGLPALRPQGDLLAQWLRGTPLRPFDLLIWALGVFAVLSFVQAVVNRLK